MKKILGEDGLPWDGKVILEVGFGSGELLPEILKTYRASEVIGVETSSKAMEEAKKRLGSTEGITIVRSDARFFLRYMVPPNSLDGVLAVFPDPFIKREKRRIIGESFLKDLVEKLKKGGFFLFITDWEDYYMDVLNALRKFSAFENRSIKEPIIETRFKRKWERKRRRFYKLSIVKAGDPPGKAGFRYPETCIKIPVRSPSKPGCFTLKRNGHVFKVERVYQRQSDFILRTLVKTPDGIEMKQFVKLTPSHLETVSTGHEVFPEPVRNLLNLIKEEVDEKA